jgi:hypothetical protein
LSHFDKFQGSANSGLLVEWLALFERCFKWQQKGKASMLRTVVHGWKQLANTEIQWKWQQAWHQKQLGESRRRKATGPFYMAASCRLWKQGTDDDTQGILWCGTVVDTNDYKIYFE